MELTISQLVTEQSHHHEDLDVGYGWTSLRLLIILSSMLADMVRHHKQCGLRTELLYTQCKGGILDGVN
jgi:hypothetical protein